MSTDLMKRNRFLEPLKDLFGDDVSQWFVGFDKAVEDLATKWDKAFEGFGDFPKSTVETTSEGHYSIDLEVPDFTKDQLTLEVVGDTLVVHGEMEEKSTDAGREETKRRSFSQSFLLGESIGVDSAKCEKGHLRIDASCPVAALPTSKPIAIE